VKIPWARHPTLTRPSLVRRLVALAAVWSLSVLAAGGVALTLFFSQSSTSRFDNELSVEVDGLLTGTSVDAGHIVAPVSDDPRASRVYSGDYWQIAVPNGSSLRAVARSRSLWDAVLSPPPGGSARLAAAQGKTLFYDSPGPSNQSLRVAALQGRLPELTTPVVFMIAEDRSALDQDVRTFVTTIAIALVLLAAGLIAAVIVQVRVGLLPLFALRREVAAVRTGRTDRVSGNYPLELEPLASELNALMSHNLEVIERQRTHVGNLAHALKTPLSVLMTEAAQRPGPLADVVRRQAEVMRTNVDHHLRRARAAARAQGQGERTPVAPVLEELARTLEKIFRGKVSSIDWRCPDDLAFLGERQDLLEIVGNLTENACKWCTSRVRIVAAGRDARTWTLNVEDDGPGLAADQRQEALIRGARLDESAPGSGLGLSIVDELVRAYGGEMTLARSPMGGLKLELILPRAEG